MANNVNKGYFRIRTHIFGLNSKNHFLNAFIAWQNPVCRNLLIAYVQYIKNFNMTPRLTGHFSIFGLGYFVFKSFLGIARQKVANFPSLPCLAIPRKDLNTKKTTPKIEK